MSTLLEHLHRALDPRTAIDILARCEVWHPRIGRLERSFLSERYALAYEAGYRGYPVMPEFAAGPEMTGWHDADQADTDAREWREEQQRARDGMTP